MSLLARPLRGLASPNKKKIGIFCLCPEGAAKSEKEKVNL